MNKFDISVKKLSTKKYYTKQERADFSHYFSLNLVMFRGSGWTERQIKKRMKAVIETYKQCSVAISSLQILTMDAPYNYLDIGEDNRSELIVSELAQLTKPIVFYIRWDLESKNPAWAHRKLLSKGKAKVDTAWMTYFSSTLEFPHEKYSIEAHEIGHILLDQGHDFTEKKNLMSYDGLLNANILTEAQCTKIKKSSLVKKY